MPFELRLLLAAKPDALSAIGRILVQEILRWRRQQAEALGLERAEGAAVSFCRHFGSSLNLNVHWHVVVPDAVFVPDPASDRVDALRQRAPARLDLEEILPQDGPGPGRVMRRGGPEVRAHAGAGGATARRGSFWTRVLPKRRCQRGG